MTQKLGSCPPNVGLLMDIDGSRQVVTDLEGYFNVRGDPDAFQLGTLCAIQRMRSGQR